ncbi:LysR family transcriptional regulator [Sphingomonas taxi]|uniref:LysR family transcriptional regulator n=1 Tax=Sphingomonas taxi TaxID=1549858 RepID=UPI001FDFED5E|nr:LysR family transcriptional regulator [Sphingomonas taxi]
MQTLAVAEYLNFRHAASAIGVSQSSVSARIKALEETLGILLFERHARGVRLTEAGRHFVERVSVGIDQLDQAVRTASMVARGEHGRLRVGVHALIQGSFLATLIERYREQHSGIEVEIIEGAARENVMRLRADRLDATFVAGSPAFPDCHARRLWSERLLVALPAHHRLADEAGVTWAELANEAFIVRHRGAGQQVHDHIIMRLAGAAVDMSIRRFDVEHITLMTMVAQGYGLSIVGEAKTLLHTSGVIFRPIFDEPETLSCSVVWSPHNRGLGLRNLLELAGRMSSYDQFIIDATAF